MDVKTTGVALQTVAEEVLQQYEVVDMKGSLPAPMLSGKSPRPDLDDDSTDEDNDDESEEGESSPEETPKTKKPKGKRTGANPKPVRRMRSRKEEAEEEEALEATLNASLQHRKYAN